MQSTKGVKGVRTACALVLTLAAQWGRAQAVPQSIFQPTSQPAPSIAQTAPATPPATTEDALHAMAQQAAVIFAGQVVGVRRVSGRDGATGVVEIEFAVEDAVRGVSGGSYTLREWAGLWAGGDPPFRAGQRYLMLLHAPSAGGLSSPVGGMDGAIPIVVGPAERAEPALAEPGRGTRLGDSVDLRTVDLRWVATRVVRPVSYVAGVAHPTALPVGVRAEAVAESDVADGPLCGGAVLPEGGAIAPAAQDAGYATVLTLLRSWASANDAAR